MGMFNTIYVDLLCPNTNEVNKNSEIQIKWQSPEARILNIYHIGDTLEWIEDEFNNKWIRTDYICEACSKHTKGHNGSSYIRTIDQKRHYVFVKIEESKIIIILSAKEFEQKGVKKFFEYS